MSLRPLLHGLSFALPLFTLLYLASGPHVGWMAPLSAVSVILVAAGLDRVASPERRPPHPEGLAWAFDAALYLHVAIQLTNLGFFVRLVAFGGFGADAAAATFLMGTSSGYSAIVVAHELIHRRSKRMRMLGRVLLGSVLYEHFYTEHIRGHHVRVATESDPATARYGERLWPFIARTVPSQFRSAWRLEAKRLGDVDMGLFDRRTLRSRVFRGLLGEWGVVALLAVALGPVVAVHFVLQAGVAVLLLECVNFVEHWGLSREQKRVSTVDSWDAESWFTYYTLVGLSRHADHHAHAARPYQDLRHFEDSPKMPYGYWGMVITGLVDDRQIVTRMQVELERRGLGPFREDADLAAK